MRPGSSSSWSAPPAARPTSRRCARCCANIVDFGLDVQQAVDASRFLDAPDGSSIQFERRYGPPDPVLRAALEGRGHHVSVVDDLFGSGQAIAIDRDSGTRMAAADWASRVGRAGLLTVRGVRWGVRWRARQPPAAERGRAGRRGAEYDRTRGEIVWRGSADQCDRQELRPRDHRREAAGPRPGRGRRGARSVFARSR